MKISSYAIDVKKYLTIILFVSIIAGAFLLIAGLAGIDSPLAIINLVSNIVAFDMVIVFLFAKYLWRIKFLYPWLVPFPDLNGRWTGVIDSNWVDSDGKSPGKITTTLDIKQTFFTISCVMKTNEMTSRSFIEGFNINEERQLKQLCYSFTTKPTAKVRKRNAPADGTVVLDIIEQPTLKLEGEYWTQKPSTGTLHLTREQ